MNRFNQDKRKKVIKDHSPQVFHHIEPIHLSIGRRVFKNALWNTFGKFTPILIQFFLTPYLTRSIGNAQFGIWTYAFMITNYAIFLDFGFSAGLTKFVSEDFTMRDIKGLSSTVNTGILFYSIISVIIIILIWIFAEPIALAMKMDAALLPEAIFVVRGASIALFFMNLLDIGFSILDGIQRMDATAIIRTIQSIFTVIGTIIVLRMGFGLRGLIINAIIVALISVSIIGIITFSLIPGLKLKLTTISMRNFKRLGLYGIKMQISTISGAITTQFDKFLSGYFISITYLAFYQIGSQLSRAAQMLPMTAVGAIMPAASAVDALNRRDVLKGLYQRGSKYLLVVSIPIVLCVWFLGDSAIFIWMRSGYEVSSLVMKVLAIAYLFNIVTTGCGTAIVRGIGRPEHLIPYSLTSMLLSIVLGLILGKRFGLFGILAATTSANIFASLLFYLRFHRLMKWNGTQLVIIWGKGVLCGIPVLIILMTFAPMVSGLILASSRIVGALILLVSIGIVIMIYSFTGLITGYFSYNDIRTILNEKMADKLTWVYFRRILKRLRVAFVSMNSKNDE